MVGASWVPVSNKYIRFASVDCTCSLYFKMKRLKISHSVRKNASKWPQTLNRFRAPLDENSEIWHILDFWRLIWPFSIWPCAKTIFSRTSAFCRIFKKFLLLVSWVTCTVKRTFTSTNGWNVFSEFIRIRDLSNINGFTYLRDPKMTCR